MRIAILVGLIAAASYYLTKLPAPISPRMKHPNLLNLTASVPVDISVLLPIEYDGATHDYLMQQRINAVNLVSTLSPKNYKPHPAIFSQIENGRPWWGLEGIYFYGPGARASSGPSEESRFLNNPYLLIGLNEPLALINGNNPEKVVGFYPMPEKIIIDPINKVETIEYYIAGYFSFIAQYLKEKQSRQVSLVTYNARDFDYNYFAVDPTKSDKFHTEAPHDHPVPNIQFIHCGGSCGIPGGCNNMSPGQVHAIVNVPELPAMGTIKLWRDLPTEVSNAADFTVILKLY